MNRLLDVGAQPVTVGDLRRGGHQHTECEAAPDDDLFDVEQLDPMPRQHLEQRRGDTRLVDSGDGDQQR